MAPTPVATDNKNIFPFFELPRELRDCIYDACEGDQEVRIGGQADRHCQAWVEGGLRTNLLLVSKQFSGEYHERQHKRATLVVDATAATRVLTEEDQAFHELEARAKEGIKLLSGPKRVLTVEVRMPVVAGAMNFSNELNTPALATIAAQVNTAGYVPTKVKLYIQKAGYDGYNAPQRLDELDDSAAIVGEGTAALCAIQAIVSVALYSQLNNDLVPEWQGRKDGVQLIGTWKRGERWKAVE